MLELHADEADRLPAALGPLRDAVRIGLCSGSGPHRASVLLDVPR